MSEAQSAYAVAGKMGILAILSLPLLAGCAVKREATSVPLQERMEIHPSEGKIDIDKLRVDLRSFRYRFESVVDTTADSIARRNSDREVQRAAALWKINIMRKMHGALTAKEPVMDLLEAWVVCIQQDEFLARGEGAQLFGLDQPAAVQAAKRCLEMAEALAGQYLPAWQLPRVREHIEQYAQQYPLHAEFRDREPSPLRLNPHVLAALRTAIDVPLSPLMAAERVNEAVLYMREMNAAIDRLADILDGYPRQTRWQAEELLTDLDENPTVKTNTQSLDRLSTSSERLAGVAQDLPESIQQVVEHTSRTTTRQAIGFVDHVSLRVAQLMLLGALLGAGLILLNRIGRRRP